MREMYGFLRLASRLANPFGHPSQVHTQVLLLQTCVELRQLASPFGQGLSQGQTSVILHGRSCNIVERLGVDKLMQISCNMLHYSTLFEDKELGPIVKPKSLASPLL